MKKILLICAAFTPGLFSFGQNDSITAKEMELLKLFGGIIKNVTGEALKENGFGNSKGGLVGAAIKNILTKTAEKSIRQLGAPGGFRNNPGTMIQLPDQLKKLEGNFQQFGKKQLLDNLLQSMNETASDALSSLAPVIAGKMVDMAVDRIITNANASDSTLTQSFDRLLRNDLRVEVLPLVEKGLKTYRTARTLGKIKKLMKKKKLGAPDFDLNDHVTTKTIDGLLGLMKKEELTLRNNPAGLLEKLFNLIKD